MGNGLQSQRPGLSSPRGVLACWEAGLGLTARLHSSLHPWTVQHSQLFPAIPQVPLQGTSRGSCSLPWGKGTFAPECPKAALETVQTRQPCSSSVAEDCALGEVPADLDQVSPNRGPQARSRVWEEQPLCGSASRRPFNPPWRIRANPYRTCLVQTLGWWKSAFSCVVQLTPGSSSVPRERSSDWCTGEILSQHKHQLRGGE